MTEHLEEPKETYGLDESGSVGGRNAGQLLDVSSFQGLPTIQDSMNDTINSFG